MGGIHDKVGALAFFRIGQLPRQDGVELFVGHVVARQDALALILFIGGDHHYGIDALFPTGFEQQRHVHHRDRCTGCLGLFEKFLMMGTQHRMHDLLQPLQRRGIIQDLCRQPGAVDLAVDGRARKCGLDGRSRFSIINQVNGGVGVVNRHAGFRKQLCGGRLAHSDRTGQPQYAHFSLSPVFISRSASAGAAAAAGSSTATREW